MKVREKPKGSGVWWIFINDKGTRRSKMVGDYKTALDVAKKIEAKLTLGDLNIVVEEKPVFPEFAEYAKLWLHTYIKPLRRETTFERYDYVLKQYVLPVIGKLTLDQITRKAVRDMLLGIRGRGLSKATVCLTRDVTSGVINHAIDDEILESNPVLGVVKRLQLSRDEKTEIGPLTKEEVQLFLVICREHRQDTRI